MGFAAFMNDPKGYLGHHRVMIQDTVASAAACLAQGPVALANGKHRQEFQQAPAVFITMIHTVGIGANVHSTKGEIAKAKLGMGRIYRSFQPFASGAVDVGFRYLPFRENQCTYMTLDPAAQFFITGPLTGCTVAVVHWNGAIWCFHSNDNVGRGLAARQAQLVSIQQTCTAVNVPFANLTVCEYLRDYHGFGFVFGRPSKGAWKFYAHGTDDNNRTRTDKWAQI